MARNVNEQSRTVSVPANVIRKINDIRIQGQILMNEIGRRPNNEDMAERVGMTVAKMNLNPQSTEEVSRMDRSINTQKGKGSKSTGGDRGDASMDAGRDTEHPNPTELVDKQILREDMRRRVKTMSPREQALIRLRFGIDDGESVGLDQVSAKFGVERGVIGKIKARELLKLRQSSSSQVVKCYVSDHT